ncbi:hypothetical protein BG90_189 [Burkholderia oklahomensis C6786]|nr:hypothetical protein BG90_189 [Burkholderia oklahomensis C6786]
MPFTQFDIGLMCRLKLLALLWSMHVAPRFRLPPSMKEHPHTIHGHRWCVPSSTASAHAGQPARAERIRVALYRLNFYVVAAEC